MKASLIVYISRYGLSDKEFHKRMDSIYDHMNTPTVIVLADGGSDIINEYNCTIIRSLYNNPEWYAMMYHYTHFDNTDFAYVNMVLSNVNKGYTCSNDHAQWCKEHVELIKRVLKLQECTRDNIDDILTSMNKQNDRQFVKDSQELLDYLQLLKHTNRISK